MNKLSFLSEADVTVSRMPRITQSSHSNIGSGISGILEIFD